MRVLLVSSRYPLPPWRGNQLRTLQWLDALNGHRRLMLCPPAADERATGGPPGELRFLPSAGVAGLLRAAASAVRGRPAQEGLYGSRRARRIVADAVRDWRPDVVVVQMVRCAWAADTVAAVAPDLPLVFDAIDCMALHHRRAAAEASFGLGLGLGHRLEARSCRSRETGLVRRATVTVAVCGRDLEALGVAARGRVVPVASGAAAPDARWSRDPVVLLSGNLGYRPTVRAAQWFADRVWPRLRGAVPGATWVLAGARPAPAIRRLAAGPGIELHGDVDDLAPHLGRARLAVAPMISGSGVPLKILEALAAGVPVIADPWSAAGLADPAAVTEARGVDGWVSAAVELLTNDEAAERRRERGLEVWRAHYRPEVVRERIRVVVEGAVAAGER